MTSRNESEFVALRTTGNWIRDLLRFLPLKSQMHVSGNVFDLFPFPLGEQSAGTGQQWSLVPLAQYLAKVLALRGYRHILRFDRVHGLGRVDGGPAELSATQELLQRKFSLDMQALSGSAEPDVMLARLGDIVESLSTNRSDAGHVALVIDLASRVPRNLESLQPAEHSFFVRTLKASLGAVEYPSESVSGVPHFNSVLWLCNQHNDLPSWLQLDNPRVRRVAISLPDQAIRRSVADILLNMWTTAEVRRKMQSDDVDRFVDALANATEGLTLRDLVAIARLSRAEGLSPQRVDDAIRYYKVGVPEDRWQEIPKARIDTAVEELSAAVIGQPQAIRKAVDVVIRARLGLSGAHASRSSNKPRGVLFFAGPTGVGKTELAKGLTKLVFGDAHAYTRFDMSEFSLEHSDQRLLGAPPGYVGYDVGGELTNAMRERPFSLVLFDEIEKAHPRILDKFLQLLDEGFITSGQGERVYFSQALVVFTSNLGIVRNGEQVVRPDSHQTFADVEAEVKRGIVSHFTDLLGRPELLNRIGENIVVFDFIRPAAATHIFDKLLANVIGRAAEVNQTALSIEATVAASLREACTKDLSFGGRGIGNEIEELFINPLGRALWAAEVPSGSRVSVTGRSMKEGVPSLTIHVSARRNAHS